MDSLAGQFSDDSDTENNNVTNVVKQQSGIADMAAVFSDSEDEESESNCIVKKKMSPVKTSTTATERNSVIAKGLGEPSSSSKQVKKKPVIKSSLHAQLTKHVAQPETRSTKPQETKRSLKVINEVPTPETEEEFDDPSLAALFTCSDEEEQAAPNVPKPVVPMSRRQIHDNGNVEKYSGIRLSKRIVGSDTLDRHMKNRKNMKLKLFTDDIRLGKQLYDAQERPVRNRTHIDFVLLGAVSERKMNQVSKNGKKFGRCALSDLAQIPSTVNLLFFGEAHDKFLNLSPADVLLVLNPRVMLDSKSTSPQPVTTFMVNKSGQVATIGKAADYALCKGKRMDGSSCTIGVNSRYSGHCPFHMNGQYRRVQSSRGGINTSGGRLMKTMMKDIHNNAAMLKAPVSRKSASLVALRQSQPGGTQCKSRRDQAVNIHKTLQKGSLSGYGPSRLGATVARASKPQLQAMGGGKGVIGYDPSIREKRKREEEAQLALAKRKLVTPQQRSNDAVKMLAAQLQRRPRANPNDQSVRAVRAFAVEDKAPRKATGGSFRQPLMGKSLQGRLSKTEAGRKMLSQVSQLPGTQRKRSVPLVVPNRGGGMGAVDLKSREGMRLLMRTSKAHKEMLAEEDVKESLHKMKGLEKQEYVVDKINATTEESIDAFLCTDCSKFLDHVDDWCKSNNHDVIRKQCVKYHFECTTCKQRSSVIQSAKVTKRPLPPDCEKCKTMTMVPAGYRAVSTNHLYYANHDVSKPVFRPLGEDQPKFLRTAG